MLFHAQLQISWSKFACWLHCNKSLSTLLINKCSPSKTKLVQCSISKVSKTMENINKIPLESLNDDSLHAQCPLQARYLIWRPNFSIFSFRSRWRREKIVSIDVQHPRHENGLINFHFPSIEMPRCFSPLEWKSHFQLTPHGKAAFGDVVWLFYVVAKRRQNLLHQ